MGKGETERRIGKTKEENKRKRGRKAKRNHQRHSYPSSVHLAAGTITRTIQVAANSFEYVNGFIASVTKYINATAILHYACGANDRIDMKIMKLKGISGPMIARGVRHRR